MPATEPQLSRRLLAFVGYIDRHPVSEAYWTLNGHPAYPIEECDGFQLFSDIGMLIVPRDDWLKVRSVLKGTGMQGRSLFQVTEEGLELLERSREG